MKPGRGKGRNEPPAMTKVIPEAPIFDYMDMMRRHSYGHNLTTPETLRERHAIGDSFLDLDGVIGGDVCWSGWCRDCGKTLISATTHRNTAPDAFRCWPCSRSAA